MKKYLKVGNYVPEKNGIDEEIVREYYCQGMVFKDEFAFCEKQDQVCYIPELSDQKYTRADFIALCDGDIDMATELFWTCNWQHPETVKDENIREGEWEICERCGTLFRSNVEDECPSCEKAVLSDTPWYIERWTEQDLADAMEILGIPITRKNLNLVKKECKGIFDDKTTRMEMLLDACAKVASNK